jgi:hypothetical protein
MPAADSVDAKVARIQGGPLIPLGLKAVAEAVSPAFGLSPSTVSRRFIRASARQFRVRFERRLQRGYDLAILILDWQTFAENEMVIALGVMLQGEQVILGFVQTATENERVCACCSVPARTGRAGPADRPPSRTEKRGERG